MIREQHSLFQTIAFRYAMLYVSVISVSTFAILFCFHGFIYYQKLQPKLLSTADEYRIIDKHYRQGGITLLKHYIDQHSQTTQAEPKMYYLLVDQHFKKIAGNIEKWPQHLQAWGSLYSLNLTKDNKVINFSARIYQLENYQLIIAVSIDVIFEYLKLISLALSQFMLGVVIIGFIGALVVSYDSRRRVNAINDSIQTIMQGNLSERVPMHEGDGEFYMLISNANKMLDRIQELVIGMRQFSNNIAHDLRTPLTRLRNNLATLSVSETHADIVESLISEADVLLATFSALLRITQIETGANKDNFSTLNLATILHDVAELYEPLAHEKSIVIDARRLKDSFVYGDKDLLFQLFANLLDNAIKYSPKNTLIIVSCGYRLGVVKVSIVDQGMGIPEAEITKVFDRFYRIETSRSLKPGNGLGLSLVAAVVELHDGIISLHNNNPAGLRVDVKLAGIKNSKSK